MKLFICTHCHDVVRMFLEDRRCRCGKSHGRYRNNIDAEVGGFAVPLGINNSQLANAVRHYLHNDSSRGKEFVGFVIGTESDRVTLLDKENHFNKK